MDRERGAGAARVGVAHRRGQLAATPIASDLTVRWHEDRGAALGLARRLVRDPHVAEDLVSEAFLRLTRARERGALHDHPDPRGYLMVTVRSACLDHLRRQPVIDRVEAPGADAARDVAAPTKVESTVLARLDGVALAAAFATLSERHREVIHLRDVDEQTLGEAAAVLGLTSNACNQLHRRAVAALKHAYLEEHLPGTGPTCASTAVELASGRALSDSTRAHVAVCDVCWERQDELVGFGRRFASVLGPGLAIGAGTSDVLGLTRRAQTVAGGVAAAVVGLVAMVGLVGDPASTPSSRSNEPAGVEAPAREASGPSSRDSAQQDGARTPEETTDGAAPAGDGEDRRPAAGDRRTAGSGSTGAPGTPPAGDLPAADLDLIGVGIVLDAAGPVDVEVPAVDWLPPLLEAGVTVGGGSPPSISVGLLPGG